MRYRFAASSATWGASMIERANAKASSSSSAGSVTRVTSPMRSASAASIRRPVRHSSRAIAEADDPLKRGEQRRGAELDLRMPECRSAGSDSAVAEHAQVHPAAHRRSVHGGHQWLGEMPDGEVVTARAVLDPPRELGLSELVEVKSRAEGRSRPGQHDHAHGRVRRPVVELLCDLVAHLDRQRVPPPRPRQRQRRDPVVPTCVSMSLLIGSSPLI